MKSIILAGVARSGKTTLAKRLQKEKNYTPLFSDLLVNAFRGHYPELGILHGEEHHRNTSTNLLPFLKTWLDSHADWNNSPFVLDITYLYPQQIVENDLQKLYNVIYVGYPNISATEKLELIRRYPNEPHDWTAERSDEQMLGTIQELIELSKLFEGECRKYGLPFIDTGKDFGAALDCAYQLICK